MTDKNTRNRFACFALALFCAGAVFAQPAFGPGGDADGNSLVRPSVSAEHEAISPDEPTTLAMRFEITEGWHVYWKNPGDTGAEMLVRYDGPEWAGIGDLRWPVPERYLSPGDLLDFVHEGSPTLLAPISIDRDAWTAAGRPQTLDFRLHFEWFVCKEICLLGEGSVTLSIPVAAAGPVAVNRSVADQFREARSKLPTPRAEVDPGTYSAAFDAGVLRIKVPGASRLTFFPAKSEVLALPLDALNEAQKQGDRLAIRYRDNAYQVEHLDGVLVIERGTRGEPGYRSSAVELRVPVKAQAADTGPPT